MIIGFRAKCGSLPETAKFAHCLRAAVVKVYRAWQHGTFHNQRRGRWGAPWAIDDRGQRRLRRSVRANTNSISQTTVQRTLLRLGLRGRRLVHAPMLTAVHRLRRLELARQYRNWTSTEWRQGAFSDESRFMLHRTDGRWRIRRETSESKQPATIARRVQAGALERNLSQLATSLESARLKNPVNTFKNITDSLPARLAAARSAKGVYSGF
ncbi:hypothetical protein MTO96_012040 [Rhipicephalus appendiculatus]